MSQKVWVGGELTDNPFKLRPNDLRTLKIWRRKEVDCPYCLFRGSLDKFATYITGTMKYPKKLSTRMFQCPDCYQKMQQTTLFKVTDMEVEEFAYWFWDNVFNWKMMERVDADKFFDRVKMWHYDDRQVFWAIYHEYKNATDRSQITKDREDFEDYKKTYEMTKQ